MINPAQRQQRIGNGVLLLLAGVLLLAGCTHGRLELEQATAQPGWSREVLHGESLPITMAWRGRASGPGQLLRVYIEGDGLAWLDRNTPSYDPTPRLPTALRLAVKDDAPLVAYLGRPCQYTLTRPSCQPHYWTSHRYAPEIIALSNQALDQLKTRLGAERLGLIGFSGGGVVAALLAAERSDVAWLVTVSANLDHEAWTQFHHVTPLYGSLNPTAYVQPLSAVRQYHLVGSADEVIPETVFRSFEHQLPSQALATFQVVPGFSHHCCWEAQWPTLLNRFVVQRQTGEREAAIDR